jgi:hypothetical protein
MKRSPVFDNGKSRFGKSKFIPETTVIGDGFPGVNGSFYSMAGKGGER